MQNVHSAFLDLLSRSTVDSGMNLSQHLCQGLIGIVGVICLMQCFTMDAKLSKAVTEAFIRLHKDGLIYRLDMPLWFSKEAYIFAYHFGFMFRISHLPAKGQLLLYIIDAQKRGPE